MFYLPLQRALRQTRQQMASQTFEENTQSLQQVLRIGQEGKANLRLYQQLQTSEFWSTQFQAVRHHRVAYQKMMALSGQWLKERRYAGYSTQGLLWVYDTVFPVFTQWLNYAQKEFILKQATLNVSLAAQYQRFLKQLALELTLEAQRIREALYQRLHMGLAFNRLGVEYWLSGFMAQINAVKESCMDEKQKGSPQNGGFRATASQQARHRIEKEGNPTEKMALYTSGLYPGLMISATPHFEISDPNQAYRRSDLGYIYLIPDTLTSHIRLEPPPYTNLPSWLQDWLFFLFWGDQVRYAFFQQEATEALLRLERTSNSFNSWCIAPTIPLDALAMHPEWHTFTTFFKQLQDEHQSLQVALKKLSPFFHRTNYAILERYQVWLQNTAKRALHRQIQQFRDYLKGQLPQTFSIHQTAIESLIRELEERNQAFGSHLFLELAGLRCEAIPLPPASNTSQEAPVFDRLSREVSQLVQTYEPQLAHMSVPIQHLFQTLQTALQQSQATRSALQLRTALETCHLQLPERTWMDWFTQTPQQNLEKSLASLLNKPAYSEIQLYAHEQVAYSATLTGIETQRKSKPTRTQSAGGPESYSTVLQNNSSAVTHVVQTSTENQASSTGIRTSNLLDPSS